jgi:hypothetical protein
MMPPLKGIRLFGLEPEVTVFISFSMAGAVSAIAKKGNNAKDCIVIPIMSDPDNIFLIKPFCFFLIIMINNL